MSNRDFAAHFRSAVGPRIRVACRLHALRVGCYEETYAEAAAEIWWDAWRLGASHLPTELRDGLRDQIGNWLLAEIEAALPLWTEAQERADRVGTDVDRYFREWAAA